MASEPPKVFISYSHDSSEHARRVLGLAERLRKDGVDVQLDQYVAGTPPEGWPRWMLNQLDWAEFVLVVCTETYYRRFRGHEEPGKGKGADWEGNLITLELYNAKGRTTKFAPVLFNHQEESFIPEPIRGHTHYLLDSEDNYTKLYAFLTGLAGVQPRALGSLKALARTPVEPLKFGAADTPTRRTTHNLPFPPNALFTGRDREQRRLQAQLQRPGEVVVTQTVAIHGLGGVGKTQLAVEYAWKHLRDYAAVFWVKADNPEALDASLAALSALLSLPEAKEREQALQTTAVLAWLRKHERWLLIADSVDDELAAKALREGLPPSLSGDVLITSRLSRWPVSTPNLLLDSLPGDDAALFLLNRVAKDRHNAGDEAAARSLANKIGNLPLALEQAAAFIIEMHWSFAKYQEQFRDARPELLDYQGEGGTCYPASVAKTWSITLKKLSPLARALLRIAAWFAPDAIPRGVFSAMKEVLSEALGEEVNVSDLSTDKALGELDRFSLVHLAAGTVSVHRLLQAVEQDSLTGDERKRWLEWAVRLLNAFAPDSPDDVQTRGVWLTLQPHAESVLGYAEQEGVELPIIAFLANLLGLVLYARAVYAQAEPLIRRALAIGEKSYGPDHPNVAAYLNNLAELLHDTHRLDESEQLMRRALQIDEKSYRPDHPNVARHLNNLARLLQETNRLKEAEPLYRQALEIDQKSYGSDHPDVAASLNDLARLLRATNRLEEAEPLSGRNVVILLKFTRLTGHLHPHLRAALVNHRGLLRKIAVSEREIGGRMCALGKEAGYDDDELLELDARLRVRT
jgi:tetratricopeptide (TPR) repeat protein